MKLLVITTKTGESKGLYRITEELLDKIRAVYPELQIETSGEKEEGVEEKLLEADILITSEFGMLNSENAKNLKWIHLTSAGTNKLPDFVKDSEILITNSSGVHPIPIAEHVFALMLMLVRKINLAMRIQVEQKKWFRSYEYFSPEELYGKKLLIVGMGRIGERIAEIAKAFGMKPSGIVRDLNKKRSSDIGLFVLKDLEKLVAESDFTVNCLPGIPSTKGIFNLSLFKKFKRTGYFINIGRGTTVVESDLIKALDEKIIAGAGLDVFEVEPLPETSGLWELENVIITPHYSGWNPNYTERVVDIFIENLEKFKSGKKMPNEINKQLGY